MGIASLYRTGVLIALAVLSVTASDASDGLAERPSPRSTVLTRAQAPAPQEDAIDSPSDRAEPAPVLRRLPKSSASSAPQVRSPVASQPPIAPAGSGPAGSGPASSGPATPIGQANGPTAAGLNANPDSDSAAANPASARPDEKPIRDISLNIAAGGGSLPTNAAASQFGANRVIHNPTTRGWAEEVYFRQTPRFYHNPLYFEQPLRERGGHDRFAKFGPAISGAQFFVQSVSLPYRMALDPPHSTQATPQKDSVGVEWHQRHSACDHARALAVQTAAIALVIWLIP